MYYDIVYVTLDIIHTYVVPETITSKPCGSYLRNYYRTVSVRLRLYTSIFVTSTLFHLIGGHSSSFQAAVRLCTYYTTVVIYALVLLAAGLTLTRYSDSLDSRLHVFVCATLGVVGTVCVVRCCQFSGRLLSTRGEWWNLWRRQAEALGVRFVVLAVAPPLAFGMLALYCLGRHGQHMAEENGSRWHGALFSYALIAPRMVEEIMISELCDIEQYTCTCSQARAYPLKSIRF